jgi:predicted TIM-barrel fold metal-dependent hydrolase
MLIVDAQVHIWGQGLPTNRAHRQITRYTKNDLLQEMDEGGVHAAVIHPPGWDPNANQVALEAAKEHPDRLSILGKASIP